MNSEKENITNCEPEKQFKERISVIEAQVFGH